MGLSGLINNHKGGSMNQHYRITVQNDKGRFLPIAGIDINGKPIFVTNIIHGIVLWDCEDSTKQNKFNNIKNKYPKLNFQFKVTQ